ncbi:MAG: DUF3341 domain-containing protein [Terriglobia bacterium]
MAKNPIYGVMAEFDNTKDLLEAAHRARAAGYRQVDAFSPLPVEGLSEAVGFPRTSLPLITFIGGLIGCCGGFFLQYYPNAMGYPLDIGGKPFDSWPAFIPITFELTILFAALFCFFGLIIQCGLPTPYHPVFNVPRFALASRERFFICIKSKDPKFDVEQVKRFFQDMNPYEVNVVPV